MSTDALVAHKIDGEYVCIVINFDGYLEGVGVTLREVFNTDEKIQELMALGNCSSLSGAKELSEVVAYARDKGEKQDEVSSMNFDTFYDALSHYNCIFSYVWDGETWTAYRGTDKLAW